MSKFSIQVSKFVGKAKARSDALVRKVPLILHSGVVHMTPVDTGRARANWQAGVNDMPVSTLNTTNWQASKAAAEKIILRAVVGDVIYVTNSVPYIRELERGSSKQAPHGMVSVTLRNFQAAVRKAVQETKQEIP